MLAEAFQYLTTPCSAHARTLGYLTEAIAIQARHRRCKAAWEPHLKYCHAIIDKAVKQCEQRRKVVVLGSGLLLDIPIENLSEHFGQVELIDIVHLRKARQYAKTVSNVTIFDFDMTGVVKDLMLLSDPSDVKKWPKPVCDMKHFDGADLVISANVLSQLPLLPGDHLEHLGCRNEKAIQRYQRRIIDHHLKLLKQLKCRVCFIADTERHIFKNFKHAASEKLLCGAEPLVNTETWVWNVAPAPEVDRYTNVHHRVVAGILPAEQE